MKQILSPLLLALGVAAFTMSPAEAQVTGNAQAGKNKVAMCIGCHGITDYKTAFPEVYHVPKIAGQNAQYLEAALKEYRAGTRKHPSMRGIADSLSDQDIADVAAYYQALGGTFRTRELPPPQPASAAVEALLKKGGCISCHGDNYSKPISPDYPKLAGQFPDYLYVALRSYRDDTHALWGRGNPIMAGMVKQFSNNELRAIAGYISSLPGQIQTKEETWFSPLDREVKGDTEAVDKEVK